MAINRAQGFEAVEESITFYNAQALLNVQMTFYTEGTEADNHGTYKGAYIKRYPFFGYASAFLNVYDSNERNTLVKAFTAQVTRNANILVLNCSVADMTFDQNGTYYWEVGYVRSGYDIVLKYGDFFVK